MISYFRSAPLSIATIRDYAMRVRVFLKLGPYDRIKAAKLLDALSLLWKEYGFNYVILPDDDSCFGPLEEAKTDITTGLIFIKESVMNDACHHRYSRASFTICHEIGHFVLHRMIGGANLAYSASNEKPKIFEDPEWQANTFASEFLMPAEAAKYMTVAEIKKTYCVSSQCAIVRYDKLGGESTENTNNDYFGD